MDSSHINTQIFCNPINTTQTPQTMGLLIIDIMKQEESALACLTKSSLRWFKMKEFVLVISMWGHTGEGENWEYIGNQMPAIYTMFSVWCFLKHDNI